MVKRPFLILGLASFFAALLCAYIPSAWRPFAAVTVFGLLLVCLLLRKHRLARCALLSVAAALLMIIGFGMKEWLVVSPTLALDGQTGFGVFRVEEVVADGQAFTATAEQGDLPQGTRVCLWLEVPTPPKAGDLVVGEVLLNAAFRDPLSDRARSARAFGTYLYAWGTDADALTVCDGQATLSWWQRALYGTRSWIHDTFAAHLPSTEAALCESMLVGARGALPVSTEIAFRRSGAYHLLVVSGLHLTLVAGALLRLFRVLRVPRRMRVGLTMVGVVLFTALCGFSASVLRAAIMMLLALLAMLLHRRTDGLNTIGMAAFFMLLADPFCVLDIGWQLSFAATLGMVALLPVWEREVTDRVRRRFPRLARVVSPVLTATGASLAAGLMTLPLTTLCFGELSLMFLPTNLLAVPFASLIVVLSMLALLVSWCAPLTAVFVLIEYLCAGLMRYVSWWAALPFASIGNAPPYVIVWLFALAAMVVFGYRLLAMRGVWRVTAVMLAVLCVSGMLNGAVMRGVSTVAAAPSAATCLLVKTPEGDGLILSASVTEEDTLAWLSEEGIRSLSWLLYLPDEEGSGTPLTIPVEHLVLTEDSARYASFPKASRVSSLGDGDRLLIGTNLALSRVKDSYQLRLGDTAVLLCGETVPAAWQEAELVILDGMVPQCLSEVRSGRVVVFGSYSASEAVKERLPHRFEEVWLPRVEEPPAFFTRGNHDITLRSY